MTAPTIDDDGIVRLDGKAAPTAQTATGNLVHLADWPPQPNPTLSASTLCGRRLIGASRLPVDRPTTCTRCLGRLDRLAS